ncbi:MAG TPA: PLP-dependent aminotransferase family protein [Cyclobacteriaceae bacterium]|jgi:2-aminoadipate transaminase
MNNKVSEEQKSVIANRVNNLPESFIREILKVTTRPDIISFAGGLPNPKLFPVELLQTVTNKVFVEEGREGLQYTVSEGFQPLRHKISERYSDKGLHVKPENILITNGSQQGLDLTCKLLLNPGDGVLVCNPTFIGALQSFSIYEPSYSSVAIYPDGPDVEQIANVLREKEIKLFYCVPNFQNPTGATFSEEKRLQITRLIHETETIILEDDPYGEIKFTSAKIPSFKQLLPEQTILLGSFSKIVAPGLRTGWLAAPDHLIRKLVILKQAADTHNNHLVQRILFRFLTECDVEGHIARICEVYKFQRDLMMDCIKEHFPKEVKVFSPDGGMFLWAELPEHIDAYAVFEEAIKEKVAFVPGKTFYPNLDVNNTFRLNFSNSNEDKIRKGIESLGIAIKKFL